MYYNISSNDYIKHLKTSIIEPTHPRVFENVHEMFDAENTLLYPTAIPNVSAQASSDIESRKRKITFGLSKAKSKLVSPIPSSVSRKVLYGYLGNPTNKSAILFKTFELTKQCAVNNMKGEIPQYFCPLCKQVLDKQYVIGLVNTPFAQQKLFLLKLFKSSGLTNYWLQIQYFSCIILIRSS